MSGDQGKQEPTPAPGETNFNDLKSKMGTQVALAVIQIIGGVLMIFGNGLVMAAVAKFSSLRSNMFLFICSLAAADGLVGIAILVFSTYNLIYEFDSSNIIMCSIIQLVIVTSTFSTLLNMTGMAVDRSLAINRPLHYNQYMTQRNVSIMFLVMWTFSISAGLCMFAGRSVWKIKACTYEAIHQPGYKVFVISYLCVMSAVQVVLYSQLYFIAHRQQNKMLSETQSLDQTKNIKSDYKAVKMLLLVVGGFLAFWIPLILCLILLYTNPALVTRTSLVATYTIATFNSLLNPIIYAWKNTRMRRGFLKLLHLPINSVSPEDNSLASSVGPRETK